MSDGTRDAVIARYRSVLDRAGWLDPAQRGAVFGSFARTLAPWLPEDRGAPMLDAACGEGSLLAFLAGRGYTSVSGFDLSPENVALCREHGLAQVRQHDLMDLDRFEPGRRYRIIFLLDILEHLSKRDAVPVLRACRERLAPGGAVVAQTPNLGSVLGTFVRHSDLTHEWGMTETSAADLFVAAGFRRDAVEVRPAWAATTALGRLREWYLRLVHRLVFLSAGAERPRIATKNLLVRGVVEGG